MIKLYHRVPSVFDGTKLVPLNVLRKLNPELAKQHAEKYVGREELMKRFIPGTSWLWNDVIHFSPVHPQKVVDALISCGFTRKIKSFWYVIEPSQLIFTPSNSIIFLHNKAWTSEAEFASSEFEEYSEEACARYTEVPQITKDYFSSVISRGGNPLMFGGIPHVLHRGTISTEDLDVIELNS